MYTLIISILCFISVVFSLGVVISYSAVHSIICLSVVFACIGTILILLRVEFFGIILIVVYLGAIIVLFLFVVMMLNIKIIRPVKQGKWKIFDKFYTLKVFFGRLLKLKSEISFLKKKFLSFFAFNEAKNINTFQEKVFVENNSNVNIKDNLSKEFKINNIEFDEELDSCMYIYTLLEAYKEDHYQFNLKYIFKEPPFYDYYANYRFFDFFKMHLFFLILNIWFLKIRFFGFLHFCFLKTYIFLPKFRKNLNYIFTFTFIFIFLFLFLFATQIFNFIFFFEKFYAIPLGDLLAFLFQQQEASFCLEYLYFNRNSNSWIFFNKPNFVIFETYYDQYPIYNSFKDTVKISESSNKNLIENIMQTSSVFDSIISDFSDSYNMLNEKFIFYNINKIFDNNGFFANYVSNSEVLQYYNKIFNNFGIFVNILSPFWGGPYHLASFFDYLSDSYKFIYNISYINGDKIFFSFSKALGTVKEYSNYISYFDLIKSLENNIKDVGDSIYTYYFICFFLVSLTLLIAMVGSIVLVLHQNINVRRQHIYRQVTRDLKNSLKLYKFKKD